MYLLEKTSLTLRHSPLLRDFNLLWDLLRPIYNCLIDKLGSNGLKRNINGTDSILVLPKFRGILDTYEPEVWQHLMSNVQPEDIIVDVGAYIGLYSVALAKRISVDGKVFAFEPDPQNFQDLKKQVELNQVADKITLIEAAVGKNNSVVEFNISGHCQSSISIISQDNTQEVTKSVNCVCLDSFFANQKIDILKIDVEGYEELVLQGAKNLLSDSQRSPRLIYIEVHLYAWENLGTTWDSLLSFLEQCGYNMFTLDCKPIQNITYWGEIIASKK